MGDREQVTPGVVKDRGPELPYEADLICKSWVVFGDHDYHRT